MYLKNRQTLITENFKYTFASCTSVATLPGEPEKIRKFGNWPNKSRKIPAFVIFWNFIEITLLPKFPFPTLATPTYSLKILKVDNILFFSATFVILKCQLIFLISHFKSPQPPSKRFSLPPTLPKVWFKWFCDSCWSKLWFST